MKNSRVMAVYHNLGRIIVLTIVNPSVMQRYFRRKNSALTVKHEQEKPGRKAAFIL